MKPNYNYPIRVYVTIDAEKGSGIVNNLEEYLVVSMKEDYDGAKFYIVSSEVTQASSKNLKAAILKCMASTIIIKESSTIEF